MDQSANSKQSQRISSVSSDHHVSTCPLMQMYRTPHYSSCCLSVSIWVIYFNIQKYFYMMPDFTDVPSSGVSFAYSCSDMWMCYKIRFRLTPCVDMLNGDLVNKCDAAGSMCLCSHTSLLF